MNVKALLSLASAFLVQAAAAWGQTPYLDRYILSTQPLVVLLEEESAKEIAKLAGRPDELAQYKTGVAAYNNRMRELALKLWKFSPSVAFQPKSALPELRRATGKTMVYQYVKQRASGSTKNMVDAIEILAAFELSLVGDGKDWVDSSAPSSLTTLYPSDIASALRYTQRILQQYTQHKPDLTGKEMREEARAEIREAHACLETKTLLIDEADVEPDVTVEVLKKMYPFSFQLVPHQAIEEAALAGDTRYTYVRWLTTSVYSIGPTVVDAATGRPVHTSLEHMNILGSKKEAKMTKKDFQEFARYTRDKRF
jgi:hypothetical protein